MNKRKIIDEYVYLINRYPGAEVEFFVESMVTELQEKGVPKTEAYEMVVALFGKANIRAKPEVFLFDYAPEPETSFTDEETFEKIRKH